MCVKKFFMTAICYGVMFASAVAANLSGTASVNVTSDTAANAKNMAMAEARRQIIIDVLSSYSDEAAMKALVAAEKSNVLTDLIESSSISGERQSGTTYSADIKMTLDAVAVKTWLDSHDIRNWVRVGEDVTDTVGVVVTLGNKISDWMSVRRSAANAGIMLTADSIKGNEIAFRVDAGRRGALTIALRNAGWKYADRDGVLHVYKN